MRDHKYNKLQLNKEKNRKVGKIISTIKKVSAAVGFLSSIFVFIKQYSPKIHDSLKGNILKK